MNENNEIKVESVENDSANKKISIDFKFFKCCSATLKRFSVLLFVINLFLIIVTSIIGVVLIGVYVSMELLTLLVVPILCVVVILVLLSRLMSALVYGFAEIVEKYENK